MAQEKEQKNALTVKTDRAGGYTIYFEHDFGRLAEVLESDWRHFRRKLCLSRIRLSKDFICRK